MAGGGERRDEEAVPAEYKPALFPGGESDWINRMVPSAESLSLPGSPTGTLTGSWLHLISRDIFLLPVFTSPLPDSPELRWAVCGCTGKGCPWGGRVFVFCGVVTALFLPLAGQGLTNGADMGRVSAAWSGTAPGALGAALGGRRGCPTAGQVCPNGQNGAGCDVGGRQPVPRALVGRTPMSQRHRGHGSESTAERCWQCCPVPGFAVDLKVKANSLV